MDLSTAALSRLLETVQQYRKGQASFGDVLGAFPDVADPDLDQLEDLLEHEPRASGLFDVRRGAWKEYQAEIAAVLERLRARVKAASSDPHAG